MKTRHVLATLAASTAAITFILATAVLAHPMTYQGTVQAVQLTKVQVKTADDKTKKEESVWFVVNKDTKIKRGDRTVSLADAKIVAGERIVIIVDMDAETKMLAEEIRLAAK